MSATDNPLALLQQQAQQAQQQPAQPQPDPTQQLEQQGQQSQQNLGQALQQSQQSQQDPLSQVLQQKVQEYTQNLPRPAQGGRIKQLLQSFVGGAGNAMMHEVGLPTPEQQQQQRLTDINQLSQTQSMDQLRQSTEAHNAAMMQNWVRSPVPPDVAQMAGVAPGTQMTPSEIVTAMRARSQQVGVPWTTEQATAAGHPELSGQSVPPALAGILGKQAGTQSKLDLLKQTQQFQTWKTNQDNMTHLKVAMMGQNKAPAAMMQTAEFAQSGLNRMVDAQGAMDRLEQRGVLGTIPANKMEDWLFGKGLVDPTLPQQDRQDIGKLRAALTYTSSAAMRAHTGRTSREIYDDFKSTLGLGQSSDALKGAFEETGKMLNDYATSATNANIASLRGNVPAGTVTQTGGTTQPTSAPSFKDWQTNRNKR